METCSKQMAGIAGRKPPYRLSRDKVNIFDLNAFAFHWSTSSFSVGKACIGNLNSLSSKRSLRYFQLFCCFYFHPYHQCSGPKNRPQKDDISALISSISTTEITTYCALLFTFTTTIRHQYYALNLRRSREHVYCDSFLRFVISALKQL